MNYPTPNASPLVTFGLTSLSMLVAGTFALCYALAGRRFGENDIAMIRRCGIALGVLAAWMVFTGELAASGWIAQFDQRPPRLALVFLSVIVLGLGLGFSKIGTRFAQGIPLAVLIGIQAFRLPLELVMHRAAVEGVMPVQMSYSGWNFDIVTGVGAILVSVSLALGRMPRWGVWLWNIVGIALLTTIIIVAAVSTPMIRAFGDEPSRVNSWVAHFPFIWLGTVLVLAAIFGHVVITRKLLRKR